MESHSKTTVGFIVAGLAALAAALWWYNQSNGLQGATANLGSLNPATSAGIQANDFMKNFIIKDLVVGNGSEAKAGDSATLNYVGTLDDGKKFDSSYDRNQPFTFTLGAGQVIKGWDLGVAGMRVGGKRELTIPPELGYGANGYPPIIPPDSTLHFTIELLSTENNGAK